LPKASSAARHLCHSTALTLVVVGGFLATAPCPAIGAPQAPVAKPQQGDQTPLVMTSDTLVFDTAKQLVTAEGNVEVTRGAERLLADRLTFDQKTNELTATGNVVLIEPGGQAFFGDSLEVSGDFKNVLVERLGALLGQQGRAAAASGTRKGGTVEELHNAVFSPCPVCVEKGQKPLWQIRANRVIRDETSQTITFRDATFDFLGLPIGWTPYFSMPDPSVKRKTGLLTPTFGTNSTLGLMVETPFYYVIAPNQDLTITPLFTTKADTVLQGQYRELRGIGETTLGGSFAYTDAYSSTDKPAEGKELRGDIQGRGRYNFGDDVQAGFDAFVTTDNTYLKRYSFSNEDVLQNDIYVQKLAGLNYYGVHSYAFQTLREDDEQGTIPIVLPLAETHMRSSLLSDGSHLTLDSSFIALTRTDGLDTRRFSSEAGWERPWVGTIGDLYTLRLSARGDAYITNGNPQNFGSQGGYNNEGRFLPRATLDWTWPLVADTGSWSHFLAPVMALNLAPTGGNKGDIPNEDSQDFEFDETNVFAADRFPGLDRVDGGPRAAYGLRFGSVAPRGLSISGVVGQSYQFGQKTAFDSDTGITSKFSDYVGRIDFRPSSLLNLSYRFRIDKQDLALRRNDLNAAFGPRWARMNLGYLQLSDQQTDLGPQTQKQITGGIRLQLFDYLAIGAQTTQDLTKNTPVSTMIGVLYTHPCLTIIAGFEKSNTQTGDLKNETTFLVRVTLTGVGTDTSGRGLFGG
jgi:LPS-assembly protein